MQENAQCPVFLPAPHLQATRSLYALDCPNGNLDCRIQYDGACDGLYRYSSQCVIASRLLYSYLDELVDDGRTGGCFWREMHCCTALPLHGAVYVWRMSSPAPPRLQAHFGA